MWGTHVLYGMPMFAILYKVQGVCDTFTTANVHTVVHVSVFIVLSHSVLRTIMKQCLFGNVYNI